VDRVQNAAQIDLDDLVPAADLEFVPIPLGHVDTGIIYEQVDLPVPFENGSRHGMHLVRPCHIDG
jgi:hypothetical protein